MQQSVYVFDNGTSNNEQSSLKQSISTLKIKIDKGLAFYEGASIKTAMYEHHALEFIYSYEKKFEIVTNNETISTFGVSMENINYQTGELDGSGLEYLWFRIPLQLIFIGWVYITTFKKGTGKDGKLYEN